MSTYLKAFPPLLRYFGRQTKPAVEYPKDSMAQKYIVIWVKIQCLPYFLFLKPYIELFSRLIEFEEK